MASETACTYACLILHDDGIAITAEKITALLKAANVNVESYWPSLFAKLCEKRNIDELLLNIGLGGGGVAAAAVTAPGAGSDDATATPAPAAGGKKEEPMEESDDETLINLFD